MKKNWKDIVVSIFIGAVVAFLTTFLEGVLDVLQGNENNIAGGVAATLRYAFKHHS